MALTERLQILIDAHGSGAIAEFKKVGAAAHGLQGSAVGGTKAMGGLGQAGLAAGGMLKAGLAAGAVAAATAIVGFGVSAIKSVQELDAAILKFQRASGATTEEASALIAAFDDMAIPAETGSKAIFQLGKRLETSTDKLAEFGITAVKNKAGNTDMAATLLSVADAYTKTTDPAQRAALVNAAFGKSGQDMIPILEKGSAGIKAFYADAAATGQIRTPEQVAQTEKLRVAIDGLKDAGEEFALMAGTALVPILTDMVGVATAGVGAIKDLAGALSDIGDTEIAGTTLKGILDKITDFTIPGKLVVGTIMDMTRETNEAGPAFAGLTGFVSDFAARVAAVNRPVEEADEALDALSKAVFKTADADRALVVAHRSVGDAQDDLNKLLKEGAVDEEKVADARTSLAQATRSLADANRGVSKSQREYDEAVAHAAALGGLDSALDLVAEAGENLADAQDTQASASERAREAAADLAKAQAGDPEFQSKLADAREKVADATYDMSQKSLLSAQAHTEETTAVSLHADQLQRLWDMNQALIAQNPAVALALAPIQTAVGAALPPPPAPLLGSPLLSTAPISGGGLLGSPSVVTNTVTVNATTSEADARLIAKEVMWNLN